MKKGNVITYEFRQLKTHEKNNFTHDLMLKVVVFLLKLQRNYGGIIFMGFIVISSLTIGVFNTFQSKGSELEETHMA